MVSVLESGVGACCTLQPSGARNDSLWQTVAPGRSEDQYQPRLRLPVPISEPVTPLDEDVGTFPPSADVETYLNRPKMRRPRPKPVHDGLHLTYRLVLSKS